RPRATSSNPNFIIKALLTPSWFITVALVAIFFSCRKEKIHHRAHRDHREKYFCSREQGLQGYGSLLVDPQSLPASLLLDLWGPAGGGGNPSWFGASQGRITAAKPAAKR